MNSGVDMLSERGRKVSVMATGERGMAGGRPAGGANGQMTGWQQQRGIMAWRVAANGGMSGRRRGDGVICGAGSHVGGSR